MEVCCDPPTFVKAQSMHTGDQLSLTCIDQLYNYYRSIILFYTSNSGEIADLEAAVRRGVEEVVCHHYPWAAGGLRLAAHGSDGLLRLEVCIAEDGGPGVQFVCARANCPLSQLGDLDEPTLEFEPLFANVDMGAPLHSRPLAALQVTRFQCGGFCVSMNTNHALFDGVAASIFLQNISSCARGESLCILMDKAPRALRIKPVMMPSQREWPYFLHDVFGKSLTTKHLSYLQLGAATRFRFCKEDLARLRSEALSKQQDCGVGFTACSRFQALAAHLWKARAKTLSNDPLEAFLLRIVVNIRGRVVASIPFNYMGNAFAMAMPSATMEELREKSLAFAVERIQEAVAQITPDRFQSEVDYVDMLGGSAHILPGYMTISSVAGLGFYEADFGLGKAAYFGQRYKQRRNLFLISDSNAQYTALDVLAVLDSQAELQKFQNALVL